MNITQFKGIVKSRKIINKTTVFIITFLLFQTYLFAQESRTSNKIKLVENNLYQSVDFKFDDDKPAIFNSEKTIRYNISERMAFHKVPSVSIAVINNGKVEWVKAYGYADIKGARLADIHTLYQAASLSKTLNAMLLFKFVEEGKLSLDKDIREYLKTWKISENEFSEGKTITLRNLLSHTGGFGTSGFAGYLKPENLPTINQILNGEYPTNSDTVKAIMPVNTNFSYSGGGTLISRKILDDNFSTNYDSLMNATLFEPLKLMESTFQQPLDEKKWKNFAHAYDDMIEYKSKYFIYPEQAPDGLWTTAGDMAKVVLSIQQSLNGNRNTVLSNRTVKEMTSPVLNTKDLACGTFIITKGSQKYFTHLGGNTGFQCIYIGSFIDGKGLVILTNSSNGGHPFIKELVNSVAKVYRWEGFIR